MRPIAILPVILLVACAPSRPNKIEVAKSPSKPATTSTLPTRPEKSGHPEKGNTLRQPDKKTPTLGNSGKPEASTSSQGYRVTPLFTSQDNGHPKQPEAAPSSTDKVVRLDKLAQAVGPLLPEFARQVSWMQTRQWEKLEGSRIEYLRETKNKHLQNDLDLIQAKFWMVHAKGVVIFGNEWDHASDAQKNEILLASTLAYLSQFQGDELEFCQSYRTSQSQAECTSYRELHRKSDDSEDQDLFRFYAQRLLSPNSEFLSRQILIEVLHKLKVATPYVAKFAFDKEVVGQLTHQWDQALLFRTLPVPAEGSKTPCHFQIQGDGGSVALLPSEDQTLGPKPLKLIWPEPHSTWMNTNGTLQINVAAIQDQGFLITLLAQALPTRDKEKPVILGIDEVRIEKFVQKPGSPLSRETVLICQSDRQRDPQNSNQNKDGNVRSGESK